MEDEALIAMLVAEMILEAGWQVVGPARNVAIALDLLQSSRVDGAILDIHLRGGERSLPVAEALQERSIPFFFASAFAELQARPGFEHVPVLVKPFRQGQLEAAVRQYILARTGD
nr:response regulator [uncultured Steroidobacter sp.]